MEKLSRCVARPMEIMSSDLVLSKIFTPDDEDEDLVSMKTSF